MTPTWRRRLLVTGLLVLDLALVGLLGWMSLFTVEADQSVVVFRHGRPTERQVCRGGLHVKWPWDEVKRLDRRVHLLELDPVERLTARFEPILVQPVVYWRVAEDAAGTFFRTLGDEDAAPRRLADLVWANLDTEIASRSLSSWMGSDEPTDASNEPALPPTIRRIGWATRLKAHDLLGIDVLDVRLRRLTTPRPLGRVDVPAYGIHPGYASRPNQADDEHATCGSKNRNQGRGRSDCGPRRTEGGLNPR